MRRGWQWRRLGFPLAIPPPPPLTFHSPFRWAFPAGGNSRRDTTAHEINVIDELTATGWVSEWKNRVVYCGNSFSEELATDFPFFRRVFLALLFVFQLNCMATFGGSSPFFRLQNSLLYSLLFPMPDCELLLKCLRAICVDSKSRLMISFWL